MDDFDYTNPPKPAPPRRSGTLWNLLTALTLLITLCLAVCFLAVFINPYNSLNPFPPATPAQLILPTATITPIQLQATWTPTVTIQPTPSDTPRPTFTPQFTATPFSLVPQTATPSFQYTASSVAALESATVNGQGCDWFGVAGTADDLNNSPVLYLIVRLGGVLNGQIIHPDLYTTVTGIAPQYGQAGFEFVLGDKPIASDNTMWIQLLNQASQELSDRIYFSTYDDCMKNLILIRFKKVR
jgi:hypothetical protein